MRVFLPEFPYHPCRVLAARRPYPRYAVSSTKNTQWSKTLRYKRRSQPMVYHMRAAALICQVNGTHEDVSIFPNRRLLGEHLHLPIALHVLFCLAMSNGTTSRSVSSQKLQCLEGVVVLTAILGVIAGCKCPTTRPRIMSVPPLPLEYGS